MWRLAAAVEADGRHADLAIHIGPCAHRQHAESRRGTGRLFQKGTTRLPGHRRTPIEKCGLTDIVTTEWGLGTGGSGLGAGVLHAWFRAVVREML